jgi:hypothetical protein
MKTREQLYGKEAAGLLRDITTYHCLHRLQLLRLYPGRESKIVNLLQYLVRQGRAFYSEATDCYYDSGECVTDPEMLAALWVLVDFIEKVEYYTADDMPIKIVFFADGEVYEVIYASKDKAALISHALSGKKEQAGKRLIIIESPDQIETLDIPNTAVFCLVDMGSGGVQYFKKE